MPFIPGPIIAALTFPGVIVHEIEHQLFCRLFGLKLVAYPIIGTITLGAIGSFVWLDAVYGVAVALAVPQMLVAILA